MGIARFPSEETRRIALLEARLNDDLSLQEIEEIQSQVVADTTDKTRNVALNLLSRFEEKKKPLIERQIHEIDAASGPVAKIKQLTPLIGYLEPAAVDDQIQKIEFEASLSSNPKVQGAVKSKLEHLRFAQEKPIVHDLAHFAGQAKKVANLVLKNGSLSPLQHWNNVQIKEVQRWSIGRGG